MAALSATQAKVAYEHNAVNAYFRTGAMSRSVITLVSTLTVDQIPLPGGKVKEMPGGPATYLGDALRRLDLPYRLITGALARVQVLPGQQYIIPDLPPIALPARFDTEVVILDPIGGEIIPSGVPHVAGMLVVDIQGFVRIPGLPTNAPIPPVDLSGLLSRAAIVKASEEEISRLDPRSREALYDAILLVTRGSRDALIVRRGEAQAIPTRRVHAPHTIGAGDNFLAAFVSATLQGLGPLEAGERAARFTELVLKERTPADVEKVL